MKHSTNKQVPYDYTGIILIVVGLTLVALATYDLLFSVYPAILSDSVTILIGVIVSAGGLGIHNQQTD